MWSNSKDPEQGMAWFGKPIHCYCAIGVYFEFWMTFCHLVACQSGGTEMLCGSLHITECIYALNFFQIDPCDQNCDILTRREDPNFDYVVEKRLPPKTYSIKNITRKSWRPDIVIFLGKLLPERLCILYVHTNIGMMRRISGI